jgi:hypothetical protein
MKVVKSILVAFGSLALGGLASAHYLWASFDRPTKVVSIGLQELPSSPALPLEEHLADVKVWNRSGTLTTSRKGDLLTARSPQPVAAASLDYGVLDRTGQGRGIYWLNYFAKAALNPQAASESLGLPLEVIVVRTDGNQLVLKVVKAGSPVANAELAISGGTPEAAKTGVDGTVTVKVADHPLFVRASTEEEASGTHGGKAYRLIRSYSTLAIENPKASLMLVLQDSFGDNHELVGRTGFIQTLMSKKLTKGQLAHHYQQRALIHEALDRILRQADAAAYGEDQRAVLDLMRDDMLAMQIEWPKGPDGWPLTNELLQDLADSAKRGPYFALGIWHVYYGGITHGGRQIGAVIAETLKVEPNYYLKSDGYAGYARAVNQITNFEDRCEMVRGATAAYDYIMRSNNADVFANR